MAGIFSIHSTGYCGKKFRLTLPLHLFLSMIFSANSFPVDLWKETEQ